MIQILQSLSETQLSELKEKLSSYLPILIGKPKYTTEEADLWFKFMDDCHRTQFLSALAVQTICEEMVKGTGNDGYGGMPDRYLLINAMCKDGFAFGFEERHSPFGRVYEWSKILYAIDTLGWESVIKDKDTDTYFKVPLSWLSNDYLVSVVAELRTITKETRQTKSIL